MTTTGLNGCSTAGGNAGALTELVARGALDVYLTAKPEATYWRASYSRCTPFSMESVMQPFQGSPSFGAPSHIAINRTGDLLYSLYLALELPGVRLCKVADGQPASAIVAQRKSACQPCGAGSVSASDYGTCEGCDDDDEDGVKVMREDDCELDTCAWVHWSNAVGQLIIESVLLKIGGQTVDTLWGEFMFCFEELAGRVGRRLLEMVGKRFTRQELIVDSQETRVLYTPLPFWFTLASGAALPLAALQFHTVELAFNFRPLSELLVVNVPADDDAKYDIRNCSTGASLQAGDLQCRLLATYVYLDNEEREKFASAHFEQLVVQHQYTKLDIPAGTDHGEKMLTFNHPVIELIWFARRKCNEDAGAWFNFSGVESRDPICDASLSLNNMMRFGGMPANYYRLVQPYQAHSCIPDTFVYNYSFSLHPEDSCTPSGSANFSRIDNVQFSVKLQPALATADDKKGVTVAIFATNFNIMRYREGLGGLAYSN